jgi:hypothetical protein|tara:strand:+ start:1526 stop:1642 length:117 start_codon:yes stop_codon:yes gene_type:complete
MRAMGEDSFESDFMPMAGSKRLQLHSTLSVDEKFLFKT